MFISIEMFNLYYIKILLYRIYFNLIFFNNVYIYNLYIKVGGN